MTENRQHEVVVWVATGGLAQIIRPGSGVVSSEAPNEAGFVTVDYEGNLYGAVGMEVFANRVSHAHDRQAVGYPTTARLMVQVVDLRRVGVFDADEGVVSLDDPCAVENNRAVLAEWLGVAVVEAAQLVCTAGHYAARRA